MMPARRYAAVAQTTASKERTLVLLLRKALSSMEIARASLAPDGGAPPDDAKADAAFERALAIVAELNDTLDPARGDALCRSLADVYAFVTWRLTRAQSARDPGDVVAAVRAFRPIVEAFEAAVEQVGAASHG